MKPISTTQSKFPCTQHYFITSINPHGLMWFSPSWCYCSPTLFVALPSPNSPFTP